MQERFETFTVLINRISRDIRRIKNQEMAAYHLRSAHVSCLYYIYSLDGVTAAELCEHCEEDKATITLTEDERTTFYRSLSAISRSLEAIAQNSEE